MSHCKFSRSAAEASLALKRDFPLSILYIITPTEKMSDFGVKAYPARTSGPKKPGVPYNTLGLALSS